MFWRSKKRKIDPANPYDGLDDKDVFEHHRHHRYREPEEPKVNFFMRHWGWFLAIAFVGSTAALTTFGIRSDLHKKAISDARIFKVTLIKQDGTEYATYREYAGSISCYATSITFPGVCWVGSWKLEEEAKKIER